MTSMNTPAPEKRRVKVSSGALSATKIASLASSHPFSQQKKPQVLLNSEVGPSLIIFVQLDVVFPSDPELLEVLRGLETSYGKAKVRLGDVVKHADVFANSDNASDPVIICTNEPDEEDVWCIDPRGHLTLSVATGSYERLGLVGQKLPFKNHHDKHMIDIPLQKNAQSAANQAKQKKSLESWDERRENELGKGAGLWNVVYCANDKTELSSPFKESKQFRVQSKVREFEDVHAPTPSLRPRPEGLSKEKSKTNAILREESEDLLEDWDLRVESLFEWVGMACLGAQRLRVNDRVNPYVALYEPPQPSKMHNVTHLQWCGLLSPTFIKKVIDTIFSSLLQGTTTTPTAPFVGITCHALSSSPVSYIPYTTSVTGALQKPPSVPPKLPRKDGEDTWSLIVERSAAISTGADVNMDGGNNGNVARLEWCLAESLGQWDARWG